MIVWACAALLLILAGCAARYLIWEATPTLRATVDMKQRWEWGKLSADRGVVAVFSETAQDLRDGLPLRHGTLDYMPLRLWAMQLWYQFNHQRFPDAVSWRPDFDFNLPLLLMNALADATAAVLAGLLVRICGGRLWQAFACAAMIWLNPLVLVIGYVRPHWDCWIFPMCLGALLAMMKDRWWISGVVIGIAAMIKGQSLVAVPFLLLVPLFAGQWRQAGRWLVGFGITIIVGLTPWLLRGNIAPIDVGLIYGVTKFDQLARGNAQNLPSLAKHYLGWQASTKLGGLLPVEALFIAMDAAAVVLCSWLGSRLPRKHWGFLLAAAIPWLAFYAFTPRVVSRYVIWAVVLLGLSAVASRRVLAVWFVLTVIGTSVALLSRTGVLRFLNPHGTWLVLACLVAMVVQLIRMTRQVERETAAARTS